MSDRELLELAAKAAGIDFTLTSVLESWNPLADDGDALRLAVKLRIDFYEGSDDGPAAYAGYFVSSRQKFATEMHEQDPYGATRRAIVRAAAEIGRGMP